jgi:SAM-dependent methyltransferase
MHPSAKKNGKLFFEVYGKKLSTGKVVDLGAQDVNGSLKEFCPPQLAYTGVDYVAGKGVEVVLEDPYKLPFADGSIDIVVTSSVFEHAELFWLTFLEVLRILKPGGLCYINVPSNGGFHRYPVDCWRFYPDSGNALVHWAERNGLAPLLLESFVSRKDRDQWNDYVAVILKDKGCLDRFPQRMLDTKTDFYNGLLHGKEGFLNLENRTEDQIMPELIRKVRDALRRYLPGSRKTI